jgi:AraC-like DNA-binding protein
MTEVLTQVHSLPAVLQPEPCETITALPHPRLRPYVLGYAGFRSGSGADIRHRVLPLNLTTLIIDFAGACRLVTGPRSTSTTHGQTAWSHGVSIGLAPAGVSALLGVPMRELAERSDPLAEFLGPRDAELAERLHAAPHWPARFALLDERLTAWLTPRREQDGLVSQAWWRLQRRPGRLRIGSLADELGVSRRYLELGFRRQIGLSPATVARVARIQHSLHLLAIGSTLPRTAVDSGYADQPHFNREVRTMTGVTPTELCALLQYRPLVGG